MICIFAGKLYNITRRHLWHNSDSGQIIVTVSKLNYRVAVFIVSENHAFNCSLKLKKIVVVH